MMEMESSNEATELKSHLQSVEERAQTHKLLPYFLWSRGTSQRPLHHSRVAAGPSLESNLFPNMTLLC